MALNWSNLAHMIGDLYDDKEYEPVLVRLQNGEVLRVEDFDTENMQLVTEKQPRRTR